MLYRNRGTRSVYFWHFVNDIVRHDINGTASYDVHYNTYLRQVRLQLSSTLCVWQWWWSWS
jgi:hypothetical protein